MNWAQETSEDLSVDDQKVLHDRCAQVNVSDSGEKPLQWGEETIMINASIMNLRYKPTNAPWMVDLNLPVTAGD